MGQQKDTKLSWVILVIVTLIVTLEIGIIKGFSVLLPDIKEHLDSQTWIIGSCISIIYGFGYTLGLLSNTLVSVIGVRLSLMSTGLLSSLGLIVCALAMDELTLLVGLLLLGVLLVQENVAIGIIPEYFDKYYNTAVNVYCFGTAIAITVCPLLTQFLLDVYGWRGTLLLLCGITIQTVVCGALVKRSPINSEENLLIQAPARVPTENAFGHLSLRTLLQKASNSLDFQMFISLPFIARVILPGAVYGFILTSWLIYIVSFALSNGASMKESSTVATWGGVGIAIIRLALPRLDKYFTYRQLMYIASMGMSCSLAATTFSHSIIGMSSTSFIFGWALGIIGSEIYVAIKDVAEEEQYLNAVSWYHLACGFGAVIGGTLTGGFFDVTGSFDLSFWLMSAVSLLTVVSLGLEDAWIWRRSKHRLPYTPL